MDARDVRGQLIAKGVRRQLLALPAFGWTAAFFLVPLAIVVLYSFGEINFLTFRVHFGWTASNYVDLWQPIYRDALARSLFLAGLSTTICLAIGFPTAYYISLQSGRRQQLLILALIVPFWTSFVVRTYAWTNILADNGPLASLARWLGLLHGQLGLLYTPTSVCIGMAATYLPLMVLPLFVALERIDPLIPDAAADLGASGHRIFWRVIVPLALPGVVAGCILVGIPSAGEYVVPTILGGGKTLLFGNIVADQFLNAGNYPFGSSLAALFMAGFTVFLLATRSRLAAREVIQ